jgi:hypothetical protein
LVLRFFFTVRTSTSHVDDLALASRRQEDPAVFVRSLVGLSFTGFGGNAVQHASCPMLLGCAAGAVVSARPAPQGAAGFECRAAKCAMGFTKSINGTQLQQQHGFSSSFFFYYFSSWVHFFGESASPKCFIDRLDTHTHTRTHTQFSRCTACASWFLPFHTRGESDQIPSTWGSAGALDTALAALGYGHAAYLTGTLWVSSRPVPTARPPCPLGHQRPRANPYRDCPAHH